MRQTRTLQLPRKVSKFIFFPSLHHSVLLILCLYLIRSPFPSTPSLIFSFHVYCMSLFHSCSTHNPVSINPLKQSPDCRLRYYSFSGEMEWVEEKKGDSQMYNFISISPVNQTPGLHWPPSSTQKGKEETETPRQVRDIKREGKRPIGAGVFLQSERSERVQFKKKEEFSYRIN